MRGVASLVGRTLSRYEIVDEISRGGMGVVYRARDVRLNREVALKVLPPKLVADPARRARFVQEAQAASALEHPHIAVIHEIDEVDGISFIAMELVRGEKLSDLIARGPVPAGRALDLAVEIAEGLARAHDKGIVHRDLKPANVMLTEDGHAKIIDFGLAKLVEALGGDSGQTVLKNETDPGMVLGTATYMSPEQARGGKVDHRSDIFSFGIVLHEMLTGRPPFRGKTGIDTMHAILHDPVPPLPGLGPTASAEATGDVQRLLEKCLAKDPESRYQGMRDVVVDLRAARRRLESTATSAVGTAAAKAARSGAWTREGMMHAQQYVYYGVALVVAALIGIGALMSRFKPSNATPGAAADTGKPSVAVLYFENNTGNQQLDWLRTGLTDMLVTDLSQSPDVEVLPTDRLVQILGDMRRQDDRVISFDTVQEIAKRAGVRSVLLGSYVKAGETIRINIKLQEAATGKIVTSERVEAAGESNLFPMVDDLTRRIKAKFVTASDPTKPLLTSPVTMTARTGLSIDRDLRDVTTSSIEAYRYYAEGISLHERGRELMAVAPLEKAVEIDPDFALGLMKLAVVHSNLGHSNLRRQYAERALQHVDRLTPRERFYIEGYYYSDRTETLGKAIDAYKKGLDVYPDAASSRNNLGFLYVRLERYDDAIREFEDLRRRSFEFPGSYAMLASAYASLGAFDKAQAVLEQFLREHPDASLAHLVLGNVLLLSDRIDEAATAYEQAAQLAPQGPLPHLGLHDVAVLRQRWADAEAIVKKLSNSTDPFARLVATSNLGVDGILRGRLSEGVRLLEAAAAGEGPTGSAESAVTRNLAAGMLLDAGQPARALDVAERALRDSAGRGGEFESLALIAEAQARLGHAGDAVQTLRTLQAQADALPSEREKRRVLYVQGAIAFERRDLQGALVALTAAEQRLTRSFAVGPGTPHVSIWYAAGRAHLAAHHDDEAAMRFQRIVDGGSLRLRSPIAFARSLYFLGEIAERRGDRVKATEYFRRFVEYWGDGEIDRDNIATARKKLSGM
jgi:tetratricopeptide (TPR) repeat protein/TolB-like protein/predicted Ser/Thr protein kinase